MLERTTERTAARARALNTTAYLALRQGDHTAALPLLGESLPLARELGDTAALAAGHQYRGLVAARAGRVRPGRARLRGEPGAGPSARGAQPRPGALQYLADMAYEQGDFDRATAYYEQCLALARELKQRPQHQRRLARARAGGAGPSRPGTGGPPAGGCAGPLPRAGGQEVRATLHRGAGAGRGQPGSGRAGGPPVRGGRGAAGRDQHRALPGRAGRPRARPGCRPRGPDRRAVQSGLVRGPGDDVRPGHRVRARGGGPGHPHAEPPPARRRPARRADSARARGRRADRPGADEQPDRRRTWC